MCFFSLTVVLCVKVRLRMVLVVMILLMVRWMMWVVIVLVLFDLVFVMMRDGFNGVLIIVCCFVVGGGRLSVVVRLIGEMIVIRFPLVDCLVVWGNCFVLGSADSGVRLG